MTHEEIRNKIQSIFIDVTENAAIVLNDETTADDIDEWDSLVHIQLIVEMERCFGISFTAEEIGGYGNVGQMADGIAVKMGVVPEKRP